MIERFWAKVDQSGGPNACWLWTASTTPSGYGKINIGGRIKQAHRVSYELHKGAIPEGLNILHSCDTPPCVNPEHLRAGTKKDNAADMDARGRRVITPCPGEKHGRAKLTESDVLVIRARFAQRTARKYELAREYGVTHSTITGVVTRRLWKHLP